MTVELLHRSLTVIERCPCQQTAEEADRRRVAFDAARARMRRLFSGSRLGPRYRRCTFSNFEPEPGNRAALEAAKAFAVDFPGDRRGLLIMGGFGSGKTHLAAAVTQELLGRLVPVVFVSVPELMDILRAAVADEISESTSALMDAARSVELLVLDDLGAERLTEWAQERLYLVVDYRYRNELPLVVTTNCSLEELEARVGGRTFSRLYEMCRRVAIDGPDRRIRAPGHTGGISR